MQSCMQQRRWVASPLNFIKICTMCKLKRSKDQAKNFNFLLCDPWYSIYCQPDNQNSNHDVFSATDMRSVLPICKNTFRDWTAWKNLLNYCTARLIAAVLLRSHKSNEEEYWSSSRVWGGVHPVVLQLWSCKLISRTTGESSVGQVRTGKFFTTGVRDCRSLTCLCKCATIWLAQ